MTNTSLAPVTGRAPVFSPEAKEAATKAIKGEPTIKGRELQELLLSRKLIDDKIKLSQVMTLGTQVRRDNNLPGAKEARAAAEKASKKSAKRPGNSGHIIGMASDQGRALPRNAIPTTRRSRFVNGRGAETTGDEMAELSALIEKISALPPEMQAKLPPTLRALVQGHSQPQSKSPNLDDVFENIGVGEVGTAGQLPFLAIFTKARCPHCRKPLGAHLLSLFKVAEMFVTSAAPEQVTREE